MSMKDFYIRNYISPSFSYYWDEKLGDCLCNQGEQDTVCQSCNAGAVLINRKHEIFCEDQITEVTITI